MVGNADAPSFGLDQLDGLSLGKLSRGTIGLLKGPSGTGKSSVLAHFLFDGAMKGESCCLVTNEPPARVAVGLSRFRRFVPGWVKEGYISIFNIHDMLEMIGISEEHMTSDDVELLHDLLIQTVEQLDVKRLVIDPLNPLLNILERTGMSFFMRGLRNEVVDRGIVCMLSYDSNDPDGVWGSRSLEPDTLDLVIGFSRSQGPGPIMNYLSIERWKGAPHSRSTYVIELDGDGVVLVPRLGVGGVS